jgi:hypothetical protein
LTLAGCGSTGATTNSSRHSDPSRAKRSAGAPKPTPARPLVAQTTITLPAPVQAPATTASGGHAVLIGGLDQADVSVADVIDAGPAGAHAIGSLPVARHDAAAATLHGRAYVIGGGEPSFDQIDAVTSTGVTPAGTLPVPASDVAAAAVGSEIYVVGGYTGTAPLNTVVAWGGSGVGRVVAHLPQALRYVAVAASAGRLIMAGGTNGITDSRAVYSFDPRSGLVARIGLLPHPLAHAAAASLAGIVYVLGGRGPNDGTQTASILGVDPLSGRVTPAGRLPVALSDAGASTVGGQILLAGGREPSGTLSDRVYALRRTAH